MTLVHAPDTLAPEELAPDSSQLRVSMQTAFESGIPPARDRLARSDDSEAALEQLEIVLVESTRAEANLSLMLRGLKHLSAGAEAAQQANSMLVLELEGLRSRIARVYENERVLQQRVGALSSALDAAARERDAWLAQEDAFLAELLDDHEQALLEKERVHDRRLAELDQTIEELRLQRDNARVEVTRLTYERDAAVALLNEPTAEAPKNPTPSPTPTSGVQRAVIGAMRLPKPIIRQKPDITSRPLVGYSASEGEVADERLEGAKSSSRPPRS
jgi:hypothetical protein